MKNFSLKKYKMFQNSISIIALIGLSNLLAIVYAFYKSDYIDFTAKIDLNAISAFGAIIGGLIAPYALLITYFIFKKQKELLYIQDFKSNFTSMISSYYKLVDSLKIPNSDNKGKDIFNEIADNFITKYYSSIISIDTANKPSEVVNGYAKEAFNSCIIDYDIYINQYFRYIRFIIETVMTQEFLNEKSKYYFFST